VKFAADRRVFIKSRSAYTVPPEHDAPSDEGNGSAPRGWHHRAWMAANRRAQQEAADKAKNDTTDNTTEVDESSSVGLGEYLPLPQPQLPRCVVDAPRPTLHALLVSATVDPPPPRPSLLFLCAAPQHSSSCPAQHREAQHARPWTVPNHPHHGSFGASGGTASGFEAGPCTAVCRPALSGGDSTWRRCGGAGTAGRSAGGSPRRR